MRIKISVLIVTLLALFSPMGLVSAQTYNPSTSPIVKDFIYYGQYGGKYGAMTKTITYTVFIPTGFNFKPATQFVQAFHQKVGDTNAGQTFIDTTYGKPTACKAVTGGYNCTITWSLDNNPVPLTEGEYMVNFPILNTNTQRVGDAFINIFANTGSSPLYATSGDIFLKTPYLTPYASIDTPSFVSLATGEDLPINIITNSQNKPTKLEIYVNDKLVKTVTAVTEESNQQYWGGKVSKFSTSLEKFADTRANGTYSITAKISGLGYTNILASTSDELQTISVSVQKNDTSNCEASQKNLLSLVDSITQNKTKQMKSIEASQQKVQDYLLANPVKLTKGSETLKTLDELNKKAYTSLAELNKKAIIDCGNDIPSQIDAFVASHDATYTAVTAYRDALVSYITQVLEAPTDGTR